MTYWMYAGLFVFVMFAWPLFLMETITTPLVIILFAANTLIATNTWHKCTSSEISYWRGLCIMSGSLMSGCANITLIYLPFVLIAVYFAAIYYSIIGLFYDRRDSQERWAKLILWIVDR